MFGFVLSFSRVLVIFEGCWWSKDRGWLKYVLVFRVCDSRAFFFLVMVVRDISFIGFRVCVK